MNRCGFSTAALLLVGALAPAVAFNGDFGGSILNESAWTSATSFSQSDVVDAWIETTLDSQVVLTGQASATVDFTPSSPSELFLAYADVDLANARRTWTLEGPVNRVGLTLGRLVASDFTSLVLSHRMDGVFADVEGPDFGINLAVGYLGLLVKSSTTIQLSRADVTDASDPGVLFAPPRLVGQLQGQWLGFPGQKLYGALLFQQDFRDSSGLASDGARVEIPDRGGPVDTQYLGVGAQGALGGGFSYEAYSFAESGELLVWKSPAYHATTFLSALGGGAVRYSLPSFLGSQLSAKAIYASGDADSTTVVEGQTQGFSEFSTISRPVLAQVFSPRLANLVLVQGGWSVSPGGPWKGELELLGFARPTSGAISEPGVSLDNREAYLGSEADLSVSWFPLSDFSGVLFAGVFLPGAAFGSAQAQTKVGIDVQVLF